MLFFLLRFIATKRVTIGLISTRENPFLSKKVPGIHYCPYSSPGEFSQETEYSNQERSFIVPFDYKLEKSTYTHCKFTLKKYDIMKFEKLMQKDAFLRIYVDNHPFRTKFYEKDGNAYKLYTNYSIIWNKKNDELLIKPSNLKEMKNDESIGFTFELSYGNFKTVKKGIIFNSYNYLLIGLLIFVFNIFLVLYIISTQSDSIISFSDVWTVPPNFKNIIFCLFVGIRFVLMYLTFIKDYKHGEPFENYKFKINFVPTIFGVIIESLISTSLDVKIDESYWLAPFFMFYSICVLPIRILNVFFSFFGSSRGYKNINILIYDSTMLIIVFLFTRGVGFASRAFVSSYTAKVKVQKKTQKDNLFEKISLLFFIIISNVIIYPIIDHGLYIALEDGEPNTFLIGSIYFLFTSFSALHGTLRTIYRLRESIFSWNGFLGPSFLSMIVMGIISIIKYFKKVKAFNIQSIAYTTVSLFPYHMALVMLGSSFSILFTYIPLIISHSKKHT